VKRSLASNKDLIQNLLKTSPLPCVRGRRKRRTGEAAATDRDSLMSKRTALSDSVRISRDAS